MIHMIPISESLSGGPAPAAESCSRRPAQSPGPLAAQRVTARQHDRRDQGSTGPWHESDSGRDHLATVTVRQLKISDGYSEPEAGTVGPSCYGSAGPTVPLGPSSRSIMFQASSSLPSGDLKLVSWLPGLSGWSPVIGRGGN
jgi:hypothetical protein